MALEIGHIQAVALAVAVKDRSHRGRRCLVCLDERDVARLFLFRRGEKITRARERNLPSSVSY